MKRFFAMILCVLTLVTLFAACGDKEEAVTRVEELDGTVWPLTAQTYSDGTGFTSDELNAYGLYGCLSFSGGKYTLMLDTSPVTGEYNVTEDTVELVNAYTLSRTDSALVLEMGGASLSFTYDSTLTPVDELKLEGTEWKLTYLKNESGVYSADALAEAGYSGVFTFGDGSFTMSNDYAGTVNTIKGDYDSAKAIITLTVDGESIYGFINGANLIVAESGVSMVYTIRN